MNFRFKGRIARAEAIVTTPIDGVWPPFLRVGIYDVCFALAAAEKAMKKHGFSLADITGLGDPPKKATRKTAKKPANPGKPKYANPDDKSQTWTGKGRRPDWFLKAMDAGKTPDDLLI